MRDVRGLERDLRRAVEGEVRFDPGSRALYATDASNYRQPPIGVVVPRSDDDVIATHRVCREYGAPILSRGAGTSLSGEAVNHAVVIDHSKYRNRIRSFDPERRLVTVESGAINGRVSEHVGAHGLAFAPDPSTHAYCTIGGNVGNNSCGVHSVHAAFVGDGARTSDNVHSLDVLTYDGLRLEVGPTSEEEIDRTVAAGGWRGRIYGDLRALRDRTADLVRERFPRIPRRVSGYNLDDLLPENGFRLGSALCGTEGTCVTVLGATLKLVPMPAHHALLLVGFDDVFRAADRVPDVLECRPMALEGIDHELFVHLRDLALHADEVSELPDGRAWLMVELGGETIAEAEERCDELVRRLERGSGGVRGHRIVGDPRQEQAFWKIRKAGLGATAFWGGKDFWPGWEDSAVPPERLGAYIRELTRLYREHGYHGSIYGHFGQGCVHSRIDFDFRTAGGLRTFRRFLDRAAELVISYGGSLSGEHGDGQARAELLPKMFGDELVRAFHDFKRIWDPEGKMNPGKVVGPYRVDENLRLGTGSNPWRPQVRFAYAEDGGDFAHATLRCVGVGKCRELDGDAVMCPSFRVLREEKHTTRGRARLLHEMLEGELVRDGWRSAEVEEALDLCLACKGCTNDCPVSVDMPTYKAEFLHHHWKGRLRPRHAYAFGLVDQAARLASQIPGVANFFARTPPFGRIVRALGGIARERSVPELAPLPLRTWFASRPVRNPQGPPVVLWPDTFHDYFHTDVGVAAVQTLEEAGYRVIMPRRHVCCGRPLYDFGFLDLAERYLRGVFAELRPHLRRGTPIVGIEPSCVATFKDELVKLLPHDDDGKRLRAQVFHFGEFLRERDVQLPRLEGRALLWGHCHQKATGGVEPEREVLETMGLEVEVISGGCCGLAGSWGYEARHHEISLACGEDALFPAVRRARPEELVVASGFSCRSQVEQARLGRRAIHLAEVVQLARAGARPGARPERRLRGERPRPSARRRVARAALVGGIAIAAAGALRLVARPSF